jgi:hypothetical protein
MTIPGPLKRPLGLTVYKEARGKLRGFMEDGWKDVQETSAALSIHNNYLTDKRLSLILTGGVVTKGVAQHIINSLVESQREKDVIQWEHVVRN